jgi:N-acetyl-gamma-glutamyl-phosphate/LysW-gamma-L-alpha-aminoadipyl-6-phosphate reductase
MAAPEGRVQVAVLGASGYVGGELLRLLAGHPAVGELRAFSESASGMAWGEVHPALLHARPGRFEPGDVGVAAGWADVLFLALPHGRSQAVIEVVERADPRLVVDTAADFRVHDLALAEAYYGAHAAPERAASFTYGLADVLGGALAGCRRIAAPGCFATATLLALYPFARSGALDGRPASFAITGSSGSGAAPKVATHHPTRAHNFFAYALAGHRHEAEITEQLRRWTGDGSAACDLLTHSAPLVRGIHVSLRARLRARAADPLAILRETYSGSRFVRVLDRPPEVAAVAGTNHAHLHAAARDDGWEVVVAVAIDNLVKGAAGQAVQAMNLALGLPEAAGLEFGGLYPC